MGISLMVRSSDIHRGRFLAGTDIGPKLAGVKGKDTTV